MFHTCCSAARIIAWFARWNVATSMAKVEHERIKQRFYAVVNTAVAGAMSLVSNKQLHAFNLKRTLLAVLST
jgi:hypothetical protein